MVIDASETGARIEHFSPVNVGKKAPIRFEWDKRPIAAEASVLWSRVHWLADAERGTIFQSGLCFSEPVSGMHEMVTKLIARSAAEQIANARGISAAAQPTAQSRVERAFLRCALIANLRWEKRWTESSEQPTAGFTIPSSETDEEIDQLCETYFKADDEGRKLIQVLARLSVDGRA